MGRAVEHAGDVLGSYNQRKPNPHELESKLLKGGLYRELYRGVLWGLLRGILGV